MNHLEIIAHRGESNDAPENTLAAFRLAWERKADAIELDVHLTRDEKLIVCHDANTWRTTGVPLPICETTMEELRSLDAGSWKDSQWKGERLPALEEVLATVPDGGRCFIELKCGRDAVPALAHTVRNSGMSTSQIAIISFHSDALQEAKCSLPEFPAYLLASFRRDPSTQKSVPDLDYLIEAAHNIGADGLNLSFNALDESQLAERVKRSHLELFVWTIDDLETARKAAALGVHGITTNRPAWLRAQLMESPS